MANNKRPSLTGLTRLPAWIGVAVTLAPVSLAQSPIPVEPGHLNGLQPSGLFWQVQVDPTEYRRVGARTWLFLSGNRISRVNPLSGIFDPGRCSGDTCGRYTIDSAQMTVNWDNRNVHHWNFAIADDGFTLDKSRFRPAKAVTAASLAGQWSDAKGNVYRFAANGRFTFGAGDSPGLGGAFRVDALTLILTFSDGDVRRRTLFGPPAASEPLGLIVVDGDVFTRKQ